MSFFRRRVNPLDPARFDSAHEWLAALLESGMETDEARYRLREEIARQARLQDEAERRARATDYAERAREGRLAAADRLLREAGLEGDVIPTPPPLLRPSEEFASGRWT